MQPLVISLFIIFALVIAVGVCLVVIAVRGRKLEELRESYAESVNYQYDNVLPFYNSREDKARVDMMKELESMVQAKDNTQILAWVNQVRRKVGTRDESSTQ